jgi:DNA-binding NarL/FixJ family response regulator
MERIISKNDFDIILWIVEDNDLYKKNLAKLINSSKGLVCNKTFTNCEDVLKTLYNSVIPDIILLDIGLPGMGGIEGIKKIRLFSPSLYIIIITVYDDDDNIFKAVCAGASGYILKSSTDENILESIRSVLNGGSPISPSIARKVLRMFSSQNTAHSNYSLTDRERIILQMIVDGLTKKKIADKLFLSFHTIDTHVRNIYNKLHVNSRSNAIAKTIKERLL